MNGPARSCSNRDVVAASLHELRADLESFVRSRVRPQDVDDVLQLAALRAIERADTLDDTQRITAWLYRIHRNLIIDTYRSRDREQRRVDSDAEVPDAPEVSPGEPCSCSVAQAGRLQPSYAAILSLVDTDGLRLAEAARHLDLTPNNAAVRLHRARKALRQAMLEHCGVQDARDCAGCRCVDEACCAA